MAGLRALRQNREALPDASIRLGMRGECAKGKRFIMIDNLFLLAIASFGWGLSLATYRLFARRNNWPMGALHADLPLIPIMLGLFAFLAGTLYAAARGVDLGGWIIVGCGILLALFWTGFLRVGSQISIFLAPVAAILLLVGWLPFFFGLDDTSWAYKKPGDLFRRDANSIVIERDGTITDQKGRVIGRDMREQ